MHGTSILRPFLDCSCKTSSRYVIFRFEEPCFDLPAASRPSRSCICQFGRPSTIRPSPFHPSLIQACCHSAISEFTRPRDILDSFSTLGPAGQESTNWPLPGGSTKYPRVVWQPCFVRPGRRMPARRQPASDVGTRLWV